MVQLVFLPWHADKVMLGSADTLVKGLGLDMSHTRKLFCEQLLDLLQKVQFVLGTCLMINTKTQQSSAQGNDTFG